MNITTYIRQAKNDYIKSSLPILLSGLLFLFSSCTLAEDYDEDTELECDRDVYLCEDYQAWQVRFAIGLGGRTNPLINSSDIPLLVMPQISYYGENFFVDNLNMGFTLIETDTLTLNVITDINYDRVFFSRTDPGNILFQSLIADGIAVGNLPPDGQADSIAIAPSSLNRKISYLAGLGLIWLNDNHRLDIELFNDISNIHDGQEARLAYEYFYQNGDWTINPELELVWKSDEINTYYYGYTNDEYLIDYQADAGLNISLGLNVINKIDDHWFWLGKLSYMKLSDEISNSPLVEKDYSITTFIGLVYTF